MPVDNKGEDLPENAPDAVSTASDDREKRHFIEKLFREYWSDLVRWLARRYGAGPPEPEEVAQAAFAALARLERVDSIRNPKAFLYTVAVNAMMKGIRWQAQVRHTVDHELGLFSENLEEMTPERLYMAGESLDKLRQAVDGLPPKRREILLRSRIQGQTYREIGAETGWSEADISRQLKQVLTELRRFRPSQAGSEDEGADE